MMTVEIHIDSEVKQLWPDTCLGCLIWECQVLSDAAGLWPYMDNGVLPGLRKKLDETPLAEVPNLSQSRKAYKAFGKDPGRQRVSSEALYRRIRQGKELYHINSVVDVNNLISVQTGFSVGSYDISHLSGRIRLRLGREGENYSGIGKDVIDLCHLPLLADAEGAFGSPSSDSTRAMITNSSTDVLTIIYGFSGETATRDAVVLADAHIRRFAGARNVTTGMVS